MLKLLLYMSAVCISTCFIAVAFSQEMNAKMNSYNMQMTANSDGTMLKFVSPETDVQNTYLQTPPKVQVNDIPLPVALMLPVLGLSLTLNPKMSIEGDFPEYQYTNAKTNPKIVNVEKILHTNHDVQPIIKHFARTSSRSYENLLRDGAKKFDGEEDVDFDGNQSDLIDEETEERQYAGDTFAGGNELRGDFLHVKDRDFSRRKEKKKKRKKKKIRLHSRTKIRMHNRKHTMKYSRAKKVQLKKHLRSVKRRLFDFHYFITPRDNS